MKKGIISIGVVIMFLLTMFSSISIVGKKIDEEKIISESSDDFKIINLRVWEKFFRQVTIGGKVVHGTDRVELKINWGDGTTSYDENNRQPPGSLEFIAGHKYSNYKEYTITCTAEDMETGNTATKTLKVNCGQRAKPSISPVFELISAKFSVLKNLLSLINHIFV